ncbi:MAG: prenyltransferase/squalene oxidase repeat-containing protein [Planctomycetota bacterium]|jgi:hypothetical protein
MQYHESDYADVLAEQLRRTPYVIASLLAHFVIAFIVAGILILRADPAPEPPMLVAAPPLPPPEVDDKVEPDPVIEPTKVEEPVIVDTKLEQVVEKQSLQETGDPNQDSADPFDDAFSGKDLGLGGPAGGQHGQPGGGGGLGGSQGQIALQDALTWLRDHQDPDGFWDADDFMAQDRYPDLPPSTGPGNAVNDVGLTGLALLAFLGDNHTLTQGEHSEAVSKGIRWLREVQDMDRGLFGEEVGNSTLYNHSIATMAMGEAWHASNRTPLLRENMSGAVQVIHRARNPYGAWRYALEANGDNDSSITGWMVFALKTAESNGMAIDKGAFDGAAAWFDTMEDPASGRVGYAWGQDGAGPGSYPSRPVIYLDEFPPEKSEALTAVALLCRIFMADTDGLKRWSDHPEYDALRRGVELVAAKPPRWDETDGSIDLYYWYYATYAMNQWGGRHWKDWSRDLGKALLPNQRRAADGADNVHGSWDPVDPWGDEGGRVYSTALCALMLEVHYRYAQILGAR